MRKVLLVLCLFLVLPVLAIGLGTLVPRPFSVPGPATAQKTGNPDETRILVLSNPIHTDLALPAIPEVLEALSFVSETGLELDFPGVQWIIVGWGSRSFYIETPTWADLKPGPVFDALTWDRSVMHVQRAGHIPLSQDSVRTVDLDREAFEHLLNEISLSFETAGNGAPQPILGASYGSQDIFFPAVGGFNAFMGCNTWTARMLREAGLKTGLWTPLPATLRWSLELHNTP